MLVSLLAQEVKRRKEWESVSSATITSSTDTKVSTEVKEVHPVDEPVKSNVESEAVSAVSLLSVAPPASSSSLPSQSVPVEGAKGGGGALSPNKNDKKSSSNNKAKEGKSQNTSKATGAVGAVAGGAGGAAARGKRPPGDKDGERDRDRENRNRKEGQSSQPNRGGNGNSSSGGVREKKENRSSGNKPDASKKVFVIFDLYVACALWYDYIVSV